MSGQRGVAGSLRPLRESTGFAQRQTRNTFQQFNPCFRPPLRVCGFNFYYSWSKRQYPLKNRVEFQGWANPEIKPANPETRIRPGRESLTSGNIQPCPVVHRRARPASNPRRNPQPREAGHG